MPRTHLLHPRRQQGGPELFQVDEANSDQFQLTPSFDMTGVLMISLALVADAVIGNVQEKTIKQYNASNSEVAEIVNSSSSLLM